ncbi:phage portal protein [Elioraea sp.]|uniref:phage portal protein n=1 Tax=Elioraea sp. TaxID=2185103 RepID=UPI0026377AFB|nr:phage portal protein [Elioraea sp.]
MSVIRRIGAALGLVSGPPAWPPPGLEAGAASRRLRAFLPARQHINMLLQQAGPTVLARARWLVRNNPYAANAVECFAANAVGAGIVPALRGGIRPETRSAAMALWERWTDDADAEQGTDLYGLQRRVARELFIAGECFIRLRPRRPEDGLAVPMQLELLPTEMLPADENRALGGGAMIRAGIEFDPIGRRRAYWFWRRHPNDLSPVAAPQEKVRVPANEVLHIVDPVEGQQIRGLSRFAPAMVRLFLLDQYDDAELERKKTAAMFSAFVTRPAMEPAFMGEGPADEQGIALAGLQPGTMQMLAPGEDIRFASPADVGQSFEAFQYRSLLAIAAALGLPYYAMSGDMVRANYSNTRAAMVEIRRRIEAFQHGVLVFQMCRPVWRAWLVAARMSGALDLDPAEWAMLDPPEWRPPKWEWVDPLKDMQAEALAVARGFKARSDVIAAQGYDAEEVDRRIAADRARERDLGLAFEGGTPLAPVDPDEERPANNNRREEEP